MRNRCLDIWYNLSLIIPEELAKNLHLSKERALGYLEDHLQEENKPLDVAIMAYALSLSNSVFKNVANDKLMSLSKYDDDTNTMHWELENSDGDIEATSYALLNQLMLNDMKKSNSIVNWLNYQRLESGSFKSTQDTVIGLQALSEYAIRAQMVSMNLISNISSNNDMAFTGFLKFDEKNSHVLQNIEDLPDYFGGDDVQSPRGSTGTEGVGRYLGHSKRF
ncbi:c3 and PZP-like alpha-2-macroglobulin domain-containing protein 8 [Trichonephila clavipes]|nr:c3 and PZP-like alpha-2-macroglobulin domain-containing protein 8 [Trichonephila clavipes]